VLWLAVLLTAAGAHGRTPADTDAGQEAKERRLETTPAYPETADGDAPIRYASYAQIVARLHALEASAPSLVRVWDAQSEYGVASPGSCYAVDGGATPCKHWFVALTNETTLARGDGRGVRSAAGRDRPQVFLSGNLHGDEVVGPTTLITLAETLVRLYVAGHPWVRRLLDTRLVVMIPVTNPRGYDTKPLPVREENGIDPNRDFPYNVDGGLCMRTAAARAVNEVWREHVFQMALTFHGGMQAIAYEWGSFNHRSRRSESPDDVAQAQLGRVMREAAGPFHGVRYPVDRMNNLVYPVNGGMEDWAYAASWDTAYVRTCTPSTLGSYAAEKTEYGDAMLRAFNVLIETADDKTPAASTLGRGGLASLFTVSGARPGRMRLQLLLACRARDSCVPPCWCLWCWLPRL
jgi:hypothetical protein